MKSLPAALTAALLVLQPVSSATAQTPAKKDPVKSAKPSPAPAPPTTQQSGGVSVTTGTNVAPPANAVPAKIEDLRYFPQKDDDPYEFERMGVAAVQKNELDYARGFFEKSWTLGELPTAAYNLACVEAKEGHLDKAFQQLERAVAVGFDDQKTATSDPDLEEVRKDAARFNKLLAGMQKNRTQGDAAVVTDGLFLPPSGPWRAILVLLHDASSDPMAVSGPFADEASARGLYLAVPRGPARAGKRRFGWGTADRAYAAVDAAVAAAHQKAGASLPVILVGVGRGGTLAYTVAARKPGVFAAVGSIAGPYDPGNPNNPETASYISGAGLKGVRLFLGVTRDAPTNLITGFRRGHDSLKKMGLSPVYKEWPGASMTLPPDARTAVRDALDSLAPGLSPAPAPAAASPKPS